MRYRIWSVSYRIWPVKSGQILFPKIGRYRIWTDCIPPALDCIPRRPDYITNGPDSISHGSDSVPHFLNYRIWPRFHSSQILYLKKRDIESDLDFHARFTTGQILYHTG